jgi:hypothetical protein
MACGTSNSNYPDYLKSIITAIEVGNDEKLKFCSCALSTPLTEGGCPILDEDGKAGAFPFCIPLVTDGVGDNTEYPLKLTLKQAMFLYWQVQNWTNKITETSNVTIHGQPPGVCAATSTSAHGTITSNNVLSLWEEDYEPFTEYKKRVCPTSILLNADTLSRNFNTGGVATNTFVVGFGFSEMKMKIVGIIYYFYPKFLFQSISEYASGWSLNGPFNAPCSCCSPYFTTDSSLNVEVDGTNTNQSVPIPVTVSNSHGSCAVCNNIESTNTFSSDTLKLTK